MHSDTQDIVLQRDSKISALWTELQDAHAAKDKMVSDYEFRIKNMNNEVS
jgi:hypothetical protein